jgi:hypothetical protein
VTSVTEDIDVLLEQTERIERDDVHTLRLRTGL